MKRDPWLDNLIETSYADNSHFFDDFGSEKNGASHLLLRDTTTSGYTAIQTVDIIEYVKEFYPEMLLEGLL